MEGIDSHVLPVQFVLYQPALCKSYIISTLPSRKILIQAPNMTLLCVQNIDSQGPNMTFLCVDNTATQRPIMTLVCG